MGEFKVIHTRPTKCMLVQLISGDAYSSMAMHTCPKCCILVHGNAYLSLAMHTGPTDAYLSMVIHTCPTNAYLSVVIQNCPD